MSFHGDYGHLSAVDAARESLMDISSRISEKRLTELKSHLAGIKFDYDLNRLALTIEGLQMVIVRNAGLLPPSRLPMLYRPVEKKR